MEEKPKRRWFQWRLSTWLVLVAIAAWAMAEWQWFSLNVWRFCDQTSRSALHQFVLTEKLTGRMYPGVLALFALAAFIGWKAVWRVIERRRKAAAKPVV